MKDPAADALRRLREGNARFVAGPPEGEFAADKRRAVAASPYPHTIVVGCSDSRVPVEVVFDAGPGEIFVVRTAGHVLAEASLASIRFAVQSLAAQLIVVLGHEDCAAVRAALTGETPEWFAAITDHIDVTPPAGRERAADSDAALAHAAETHVRNTVDELTAWLDGLDLPTGPPVVVGATYELNSGQVHWLD